MYIMQSEFHDEANKFYHLRFLQNGQAKRNYFHLTDKN